MNYKNIEYIYYGSGSREQIPNITGFRLFTNPHPLQPRCNKSASNTMSYTGGVYGSSDKHTNRQSEPFLISKVAAPLLLKHFEYFSKNLAGQFTLYNSFYSHIWSWSSEPLNRQ